MDTYNPIHVGRSTFLGGLSAPVHRWFRLTPSFGPELVDVMLSEMMTEPGHVVLDPFSGAGTTLYQSKFNRLESCGFEINPFLHFVCRTSTSLGLDPALLRSTCQEIASCFAKLQDKHRSHNAEALDLPLPAIHNVYRWWRPDVLKDLLLLKQAVAQGCPNSEIHDFFLLGLAGVLVPDLTNVTLGRLQLHFVDKSEVVMNVWPLYAAHINRMIEDLEQLDPAVIRTPATVYLTDSTAPGDLPIKGSIDRVVTSPPYPNRYSYVWNTRPFLYFFDFFTGAADASELDKQTIGGTWGTATSILAKGRIEPAYPVLEQHVQPIVEQIRKKDNLMANYVMKYFNLIANQIMAQEPFLAESVKCAYVVGCSRIKEVYVETDRLLGEIFEGLNLGYRVDKIERFRRRHSGKELYESVVYASKNQSLRSVDL